MGVFPLPGRRISGRRWKGSIVVVAALAVQACTIGGPTESAQQIATGAEVLLESTASMPEIDLQSPAATDTAPLLPVYWLGEANGLLYREFLPAESTGDPIAAAVWAMTSSEPLDDDYYSPWQEASSVNTSISPDNVITIDISSDSFAAGIDAAVAGRAVQQLVYTATAAAASAGLIASGSPSSVRLLVDGKAGYNAFGHIELGSLLGRDVSAVAPVWIINPQDGTVRSDGTVIVQGSTTTAHPTLEWRVRRVDGGGVPAEDVVGGTVPVEAGSSMIGLYEFSVALEQGTFLIEVYEPAESEPGTAPAADAVVDDKLVSIR
ncbi:GerMN domain-containing protein [uncultured Arthrobacter sp.]|uniref:GerMN domain-containing protein n=1 Tax=uncultured Arthrobacter sp. TaxID=114050 RepID=UPI00261A6B62|nr:GerMN domain-containing protein [uncultured Arthrobacter sp.]